MEPLIREHRLEVTRTARYHTLGGAGGAPRRIWFVCHGYRQLARYFIRQFLPLDDGRTLVVAPEGLSRFYIDLSPGRHGPEHRVGATWMTREDREAEIRDYVRYLDALAEHVLETFGGHEPRITVLGFSQGGHTAARWVALGRVRPHELVLWGADLPPDLEMESAAPRLRRVRLTPVYGEEDPSTGRVLREREAERMDEWGIPYRSLTHPGGHRIDPDLIRRLAEED